MRSRLAIIITSAILLVTIGFIGGVIVTGQQLRGLAPKSLQAALEKLNPSPQGADYQQFLRVWDSVHRDYVNAKVDDAELLQGAISGLVGGLHDPYSMYFSAAESKQFQDEIAGTFEGVGMEIGYKDDHLVVIAPLEDSPAAKAGIVAGDVILAIDKQDASRLSVDEAVKNIRGQKGTTVTLVIRRGQETEPRTIAIVRSQIVVNPVTIKLVQRDEKTFAHIRLTSFSQDATKLLRGALAKQDVAAIDGFILDLRNNPGGYLNQAVDITAVFLRSGEVVAEVDRTGQKETFSVNGQAALPTQPLVVLVNGGSASASEIVAGALQDHRRAKLVGVTTFGKGTVQEYETLADGSSLKLTVAKWFTPNGTSISEQGITPDIAVELTNDDISAGRDPQLQKAVDILLGAS
ncbi:MAG: S41 family peptidase [Candidatus Kerfeldbacteria bacterium]|nr:S41 family peptidase [Candidatus Kerfeldbacteria bacterium]